MTLTRFALPSLLVGSAAIAAACATHTSVTPTASSRSFSPVCVEGVTTYDDFTSIPSDYYEVAYITSEQNSIYTDKDKAIAEMRKRAGEQGGNALVVNSINSAKQGIKLLGATLGGNSADRQAKATAIYIPADSMRVKNACGHN
jgi:uncharacterized protein YbjQ (UPF0145 family)